MTTTSESDLETGVDTNQVGLKSYLAGEETPTKVISVIKTPDRRPEISDTADKVFLKESNKRAVVTNYKQVIVSMYLPRVCTNRYQRKYIRMRIDVGDGNKDDDHPPPLCSSQSLLYLKSICIEKPTGHPPGVLN